MILNFKPQFKGQILNGTKIHSIRYDQYRRWKPGMVIHFATGARTKLYDQFWYGHCKSIQDISIERRIDKDGIISSRVWIDKRELIAPEIVELAVNDGFVEGVNNFLEFFISKDYLVALRYADHSVVSREVSLTYHGRIIHWTCERY